MPTPFVRSTPEARRELDRRHEQRRTSAPPQRWVTFAAWAPTAVVLIIAAGVAMHANIRSHGLLNLDWKPAITIFNPIHPTFSPSLWRGGGAPAELDISALAHELNEDFIEAVAQNRAREFRPAPRLVAFDGGGGVRRLDVADAKFFTYASDNGWNNQLLNLLYAADMARLLNRTLLVPPFAWPRRRGAAKVSVARLVDATALATLVPRGVVFEDEHGSAAAALAGLAERVVAGEGQPHRKQGMPRWRRERWVEAYGAERAPVLRVTCCLLWTWLLPDATSREFYGAFRYHPALRAAAAAAAAPLGRPHDAIHVRRGDKVKVDRAYVATFGKYTPAFFLALMADAGFGDAGAAPVYVATDELDRGWFAPLAAAGHNLSFARDLDQGALWRALSAFPQPLWPDVLAIVEQQIAIDARRFVGSLPSTLSGHVVNARAAAGEGGGFFVKLHESCCDARTAADLLRLPGVRELADVPCHAQEGNEWC